MVNVKILAGGFASFIATYVFDSDNGTLELVGQTTTGNNPSWIASHPQNQSILYAVNEIGPVGDLQSFLVDGNGDLTLVDTVSTGGNGPTFTNPTAAGEVSALNFGSPNASIVATDPDDPTKFLKDSPIIEFPVNGGPSNPHMSLEVNGEILVADLGADKIWRLINDGAPGNFKVHGEIGFPAGNGPRHIAFHDGVLFTLHELTSVLTAQVIPQELNVTEAPLLANVSIIPQDANLTPNGTLFRAAEILVSTPTEAFPEPLIYVSNRNIGATIVEEGDTIAIFRFNNPAGNGPATEPDPTNNADNGDDSITASGSVSASASSAAAAVPSRYARPPRYSRRPRVRKAVHRVINKKRDHARQFYARQEDETPVLELLAQVPTGLQQIRSMAISNVDGTEQFLIAGANTVGGVAIFERVDGGANLELVVRNTELENRTSFVFLP